MYALRKVDPAHPTGESQYFLLRLLPEIERRFEKCRNPTEFVPTARGRENAMSVMGRDGLDFRKEKPAPPVSPTGAGNARIAEVWADLIRRGIRLPGNNLLTARFDWFGSLGSLVCWF